MSRGRRLALILPIAALGLIAFAALGFAVTQRRDLSSRVGQARSRGDWPGVIDLTEGRPDPLPSFRRDRAFALGKVGRDDEALSVFEQVSGQSELTSDELRVVAEILDHRRRGALAWLARDAAARAERTDLNRREARPRPEVEHLTQHLLAAGHEALASLILGLARLADSDSPEDPAIDRLTGRDHAAIVALKTPRDARKLLARVAMEIGKPEAARSDLEAILTDGPDPETSWLLSRAYLQLGKDEAASTALADANDFGSDRPHEPEPAPYVGAKACRECHRAIYDAQQAGRHATTITHGADLARIPLPDGIVNDPVNPDVSHEFRREGDKVRLTTKTRDARYEALMEFAVGSGHRGMTLVGRDAKGVHREARISLYSEAGTAWDVTSGFTPHPGDVSEYLGKILSPKGFRQCIDCHVTRFRPEHPGPEARDRGIGCERCHGPGGDHVLAMRSGFGEPAIGRFSGATSAQKMTACSGCHASDGTFPVTDPQFVRFQSTTLEFSRCFTESGGALDCTTCHDPHKPLETSPAFYEAKCLSCHDSKASGGATATRAANSCPVNPSRDCLSCHMPNVPEVAPHTSFTDHHIRARRPETGGEGGR